MIKRIQFLLLILSAFAFFSCSNQVEKSASVSFSLSKNAVQKITSARAATDDSASETKASDSEWSLKISLSGGYSDEKIYPIEEISDDSSQFEQQFILNGLTAGETVEVDVNVYYGEVQYFKAKETQTLTLAEGENSVDIVLERVGNSEISIADSGSISISAVDSDGNSYVYSSSSVPTIPYLKATTFTISNTTFDSYTWYLNGEKLSGTGSSISLTPAENKVSLSGKNSLVCFYGTNFLAEFKFTTSDSASTSADSETSSE